MVTRKMTDAARWQAVVAKDKAADGQFYFSVRTTGVYCRPSCPARKRARKSQIDVIARGLIATDASRSAAAPGKRASWNR